MIKSEQVVENLYLAMEAFSRLEDREDYKEEIFEIISDLSLIFDEEFQKDIEEMTDRDENKYYTPSLEEFHVGFEFEREIADKIFNIKLESYDFIPGIEQLIENGRVRVKYLDQEDIKDLNFKPIKKSWVGYESFVLQDIKPEYPYFLKATLHFPIWKPNDNLNISYKFCKIYVHRWVEEGKDFDDCDESHKVYEGFIKNKSEFKKILKLLGV